MEKLNRFERFFHNKQVIKGIFIFPLLSSVIIGILLKSFADLHPYITYMTGLNRVLIYVLLLIFINMLANFAALVLYYCLSNRINDLSKKYRKKL